MGLIPRSGRSPGGENGNSLQYSCLKNHLDRGAWQATVHRVTKNWAPLNTRTTTTNDYLNVLITCFLKPRCFQMMLEAVRKHCIDY